MKLHSHVGFLTEGSLPPLPSPVLHTSLAAVIRVASPPAPPAYESEAPIFLSPFAISAPAPSPVSPSHHKTHIPTAAIAGGTVAGSVVAIAVVATVVSAVAGKAGLGGLLLPVVKLLGFHPRKLNGILHHLYSHCHPHKDGSEKPGDSQEDADKPTDLSIDVLAAGGIPDAKAEAAASLAYKSQLYSTVADQYTGTREALLAQQVNDIIEELNKQKALIMQPLSQGAGKVDTYFESLNGAMSKATDQLEALKSSTQAYGNAQVLENRAEADVREAVFKQNKNKNLVAENKPAIAIVQTPSDADELAQQISIVKENKSALAIVQTPSDADELAQQISTVKQNCNNNNDAGDEQDESSLAIVPITAATEAAVRGVKPTARLTVPVETNAIIQAPAKTTLPAMTASQQTWWPSLRPSKGSRADLGHVAFSCEMSALKLRFFTSCRSGGIYGSPPLSPARNDLQHYNRQSYLQMNPRDYASNLNVGGALPHNRPPQVKFLEHHSHGQQERVQISDDQNYENYSASSVENHQLPTSRITLSNRNTSQSFEPSEYGDPFDGVL